ncbi:MULTISPECIES: DUF6261 family protein [unclassified Empedobacter]|uniref:DUF6261 family protein n=2 Tax=Weeksellaceae TaxID=2762318 RepID=UPI0025774902|nr:MULTISPECIES: DUF6261 family protein [unclassified Empedobacter]MDM1137408.1 hypothetical protein [Empedobacter sp. R132-2]
MKINLQKLSTKNLATLAQRTINSSQAGNYTIVENHPLLLSLIASYQNYDTVYTKLTYSGKGKEVATADKERDVAFSNMKAFLNGYRKLTSVANYQDAEALYKVFQMFGLDLDRLSYSAETAQLKKLIEELEKPDNTLRIINLSLVSAFDDLKTKHTDFEILFAQQAEANADLRQISSASSSRKELEQVLRSYLNLITAMKDVPDWSNLYHDLNEIVKAARNSVLPAS